MHSRGFAGSGVKDVTDAAGVPKNIDVHGTRRIVDSARITPAVVEVESHPYHPQ